MKNFLTKLTPFLKSFRYGDRIHPMRDWLVLLSVTLLLIGVSLLWNIWLFARVTGGESIGAATSTPALNTPAVSSVEALFQARSTEESNYKGVYRFVDPSL